MGSSKGPRSDRTFNFVRPERYIERGDQMRAKAAKRAMFTQMGDHSQEKPKTSSAPKYGFVLHCQICVIFLTLTRVTTTQSRVDESVDANKVPLAARRRVVNGVRASSIMLTHTSISSEFTCTLHARVGALASPSRLRHAGHGVVGHGLPVQRQPREQQPRL